MAHAVAAGAGLIEKPFRSEDLAREVTRMLQRGASSAPAAPDRMA